MTLSRSLAEPPRIRTKWGPFSVWITTFVLIALSLFIRIITERQLLIWVDEPATGLAVMQIAKHGSPILPSGLFYTQGVTLSYLAAPFALFLEPVELIEAIRWLLIALSIGTALAAAGLVWHVSRSWLPVAFVLFAIALDHNMIIWSIYARPYGILTMLTVLITWCVIVILQRGDDATWRRIPLVWILTSLIWIATFTHLGIWMVVPGIPLAVLAVRGLRDTLRSTRIIAAGAVSALAPILLFLAGATLSPTADPTTNDNLKGFTGGHLFSLDRWATPDLSFYVWRTTFGETMWADVMPWFIVGAFAVAICLVMFDTPAERRLRPAVATLTALYWTPNFLLIAITSSNVQGRYLAHIAPLGYITLALATWMLAQRLTAFGRMTRSAWAMPTMLSLHVLLIPIVFLIQTADARMQETGWSPDYIYGSEYVAERHQSDEQIFMAFPPATGLVFSDDVIERDVAFLAGGPETERATRYTLLDNDGNLVDYWLGTPVINTTKGLCRALTTSPTGSWLLVDTYRMNSERYYAGSFADVILATSDLIEDFPNGLQVRRVSLKSNWDFDLLEIHCGSSDALASRSSRRIP